MRPSPASIARLRPGGRLWTAADDAVFRQVYPDVATDVLALRLGRTVRSVYARAKQFGLRKSATYLASPAACRLRRGDRIGAATRFQPGQVPFNKGLRRPGWGPGRMKETQFKPGVRRGVAVTLYKPIGTERVSKDGYLERKVNDSLPLQARWRFVHLVLWESVHGPVPAGYAVVFRNGNRSDIRLDNLELIARRDLMARNSVHTLPKPLPQVIQLLGALNRQIRRKSRREEQARRSA